MADSHFRLPKIDEDIYLQPSTLLYRLLHKHKLCVMRCFHLNLLLWDHNVPPRLGILLLQVNHSKQPCVVVSFSAYLGHISSLQ